MTQTSPLPTRFETREALIATYQKAFPAAAAVHPAVSERRGGRAAAEARLADIDPPRYRQTRNQLDGAVTHLSPYLRHGVLTLADVRQAALAAVNNGQEVQKLLSELGWRDYYQRVYTVLGDAVWDDIEPYKTGWGADDYDDTLPDDIRAGETGLPCIDHFIHTLVQTGYLHNHARLWLAAYVVHWRKVWWRAGAGWFLEHLLDGDPASNNLSWQWVASTFSHKPYFFNRENLEKYSGGRFCADCPLYGRCPFEGSYEALQAQLFRPAVEQPDFDHPLRGKHARPRPEPQPAAPEQVLVWVHGDRLGPDNPALTAYPTRPAIWVWDELLLARWRISLKRLIFIAECLQELPVEVHRGEPAAVLAAQAAEYGASTIATTPSASPRFAEIVAGLEARGLTVSQTADPPFVAEDRPFDLRRFSRYWRDAQKLL